MKLDDKGYQLIAGFEGLSLVPYLCSAKVPTIGYGNTFYLSIQKKQIHFYTHFNSCYLRLSCNASTKIVIYYTTIRFDIKNRHKRLFAQKS